MDNPDRVHRFIQQEVDSQAEKGLMPKVESEIHFKEEMSLKEKPHTEETMKVLESKIELKVAAQSIIIDGKVVGYVSDQQNLDFILDEIKRKYGPLPLPNDKSKTVTAASSNEAENTTVVQFKENVQTKTEQVSQKMF